MFPVIVFLFIALPLAELALLIKVGTWVGAVHTILLVVLTAILGASLARYQGIKVLYEIHSDLSQGLVPTDKLLDGVLILVAGVMLLTPGFITDAAGFFLLWPEGRRFVRESLRGYFAQRLRERSGVIDVQYYESE